jgi:predicted nucleic acid-binding protein
LKKTFLDSGVLLTAWRADRAGTGAAMALLAETDREFYSSQMVRLELFPKAIFHKQEKEIAFYEKYFRTVTAEEPITETLAKEAYALAGKYGLAAADSLLVAAAIRQKVEEFITSELQGKPLFRVTEFKAVSLYSR